MVFKKFEKNQIMGQIIIDFLPKLFHENHKFFKVFEITRMGVLWVWFLSKDWNLHYFNFEIFKKWN